MMQSNFQREVQVYVLNGSAVQFTLHEARKLVKTWPFWVMMFIGFSIILSSHPVLLPQFDSMFVGLAYYIISLIVYLTLMQGYTRIVFQSWFSFFHRPIPLLLLSAPLILFVTNLTAGALTTIFEPGRPPFASMTWQTNLRCVLTAHVFESIALLWLVPVMRAKSSNKGAREMITLAGRKVELKRIKRVKAAEHYLEIYTDTGVELIRERLATFLEQVSETDGVQTHRSHWVCHKMACSLLGTQLELKDGEMVPIARGRMAKVKRWIDANCDMET